MTNGKTASQPAGRRSGALMWAGLLISAMIFVIPFRNIDCTRRGGDAVENGQISPRS